MGGEQAASVLASLKKETLLTKKLNGTKASKVHLKNLF